MIPLRDLPASVSTFFFFFFFGGGGGGVGEVSESFLRIL